MNRTSLPEMLHGLNKTGNVAAARSTDLSVPEGQRAVLKWQQDQLQLQFQQQQQQPLVQCYFNELNMFSQPAQVQNFQGGLINEDGLSLNEFLTRPIKPDPSMENGWLEFGSGSGITMNLDRSAGCVNGSSSYGINYAISGTTSCPPTVVAAATKENSTAAANAKGIEPTTSEKLSATAGRESFRKRKAEQAMPPKVDAEQDNKAKKIKGCAEEEESKNTDQRQNSNRNSANNNNKDNDKNNREGSGCTSKENSKASEHQKPDYIHVRARRGQATDSHSLAERVRREKISERMKYLQDLVPGCNKISGKAGMLDEIINYVQSLQRQVEFLSMKLAAVNPRLDFNIDDLFTKEVFPDCPAAGLPTMGVSTEITNHSYLQYNPKQAMGQLCVSEGVNPVDISLQRSISAPVSIPETFLDTSCFNQIQNSLGWEGDLQSLFPMEFQQARPTFPSQIYTGPIEAGGLKMEM
ncbi:hypothetical protein Nepgr_004608 [Nepenthes gracilis]|uniref:BHLH domain-containing protein n=1 Tax=Nepenthes gracilis TaxID=150966 RepID=A0AAD3S1Z0_NEPGR|nr:hypothetical protein Nepgr_004608 [Nepenthes gracilis]